MSSATNLDSPYPSSATARSCMGASGTALPGCLLDQYGATAILEVKKMEGRLGAAAEKSMMFLIPCS